MLSKKNVVRVSFFKAQLNTHTNWTNHTTIFGFSLKWCGNYTTMGFVYAIFVVIAVNEKYFQFTIGFVWHYNKLNVQNIQYDCKAIETIDVWCCVNFVGCGLLAHINQTMWSHHISSQSTEIEGAKQTNELTNVKTQHKNQIEKKNQSTDIRQTMFEYDKIQWIMVDSDLILISSGQMSGSLQNAHNRNWVRLFYHFPHLLSLLFFFFHDLQKILSISLYLLVSYS